MNNCELLDGGRKVRVTDEDSGHSCQFTLPVRAVELYVDISSVRCDMIVKWEDKKIPITRAYCRSKSNNLYEQINELMLLIRARIELQTGTTNIHDT